jgi:hypothetical protein
VSTRPVPLSVTVPRAPGEAALACHARAVRMLRARCRDRRPGREVTAIAVARLDHDAITVTALATPPQN